MNTTTIRTNTSCLRHLQWPYISASSHEGTPGTREGPRSHEGDGTSLKQLAELAGINEDVVTFLEKRGFGNPSLLAMSADSFTEVDAGHWQPWCQGVQVGEEEWKIGDGVKFAYKVALRHLWNLSRKGVEPEGDVFAPTDIQVPWEKEPETTKHEEKNKDQAGEAIQLLIQQYEAVQIDGRNRKFPMKSILGAEKIVH